MSILMDIRSVPEYAEALADANIGTYKQAGTHAVPHRSLTALYLSHHYSS